jgi:tripartite-type tricarboxylate transporter receptor subunit TctC
MRGGFHIKTTAVLIFCFYCFLCPIQRRHPDQEFYKGKTVRIIVGFAAGGGFDAYARAITPYGPAYFRQSRIDR